MCFQADSFFYCFQNRESVEEKFFKGIATYKNLKVIKSEEKNWQ